MLPTLFGRTSRPILVSVAMLLAGLTIWGATVAAIEPRHDRPWRPEIAVMPDVTVTDEGIGIDAIRDWTYRSDGPVTFDYRPGIYREDELVGMWFMVEPFGGSDAIAHTLVLFEFTGDRLLALTIEARKEEGELYSALKGAFNTFELVYLWAEARDVLTRRARYLQHEVFVYPLRLSKETQLAFLRSVIAKTEQLETEPRFYNTLFSNCTNELAKSAGLSWNTAFILTGYAANHLWREDVIPGRQEDTPFDSVRQQADMASTIDALPDEAPDMFNRALLGELRARFSGLIEPSPIEATL
ncbi:MAG: DUF4105 domain-containing protein [Pseudomonadota bacterium]